MHLGIDFWKDFGGFLEDKRSNIEGKSMEKWIENVMHLGMDF